MGQLEASASVRWTGWHGSVTGSSGKLEAPTATQAELGGPGTGTNPEELLAAAHANCFTSTLTSLARARRQRQEHRGPGVAAGGMGAGLGSADPHCETIGAAAWIAKRDANSRR